MNLLITFNTAYNFCIHGFDQLSLGSISKILKKERILEPTRPDPIRNGEYQVNYHHLLVNRQTITLTISQLLQKNNLTFFRTVRLVYYQLIGSAFVLFLIATDYEKSIRTAVIYVIDH